ncbi:leucyl aminopeptidase family protein [Shimia ponticola]|uniref:leucyl aminopeptidase family protein n=1 Tax=Shimia ponticola TaxID=2582893 RepID=UPI0011BDABF9|nr:leucyl aminopeptidase family protein [Shimia ponticola]
MTGPRAGFAPQTDAAIPLHLVATDGVDDVVAGLGTMAAGLVKTHGFQAALGDCLVVPAEDGSVACALIGVGTPAARARRRDGALAAVGRLPGGTYTVASAPEDVDMSAFALGWLLSGYRFDRYAKQKPATARLVAPKDVDAARLAAIAAGEALTRDLINTPASDMGPDALEQAARDLAAAHGADIKAVTGDDLLDQNFPMIHTVGRASATAPRLLDIRWGEAGPTLTLVGKGVCFDTGGLNIKPGGSMGLMKKDMGGAATVLGLAHMIMATGLPLQLRVLIPAVENAISGDAFRPQDILTSRKGLTVEINNTDAEGRLVLADALALAEEETPDLLISMATLTGAARVAVGPDLAPYYTDANEVALALEDAAVAAQDPVWRMPFHAPYEAMIEPGIADLDNAPKGGFAGSITAALFLRRFASEAPRYVHFDIYGWQPAETPTRQKGGVGQGARAVFEALPRVLDL